MNVVWILSDRETFYDTFSFGFCRFMNSSILQGLRDLLTVECGVKAMSLKAFTKNSQATILDMDHSVTAEYQHSPFK